MSKISRRLALLGAGAGLLAARTALPSAYTRRRVWVGTFTNASGEVIPTDFGPRTGISRGLYTFEFDTVTGRAGDITLAIELSNPANLTMHRNGRVVYAARGQNSRLEGQSPITALAVEGARLRELNSVPSGGRGPTIGVVDRSGRNLLATNFSSNSIVCFRLNRDGSLGERSAYVGKPFLAPPEPSSMPAAANAMRNDAPGRKVSAEEVAAGRTKPHAIVLSRSERYAVAAEIDSNRCVVLRFDARRGSLEPHSEAPAPHDAGPRHLQFGRDGRFLYTSDEADSGITAWRWDESRGSLTAFEHHSTLPAGYRGSANHPADIQVHPSGRFVYVSNRATGTLAGFRISERDGSLTRIADTDIGSPSSWSFLFDPTGRWALVSAQIGDYVAIYAVNVATGVLTPTGQRLPVVLPTSIRMS